TFPDQITDLVRSQRQVLHCPGAVETIYGQLREPDKTSGICNDDSISGITQADHGGTARNVEPSQLKPLLRSVDETDRCLTLIHRSQRLKRTPVIDGEGSIRGPVRLRIPRDGKLIPSGRQIAECPGGCGEPRPCSVIIEVAVVGVVVVPRGYPADT